MVDRIKHCNHMNQFDYISRERIVSLKSMLRVMKIAQECH
jgi:hypothetical protein